MHDTGKIFAYYLSPKEYDNSEQKQQYFMMLSADEQQQYQRFVFDKDRFLYAIAHAFLRMVLSDYTNIAASELMFTKNQHGKPAITNDLGDNRIFFNLSHTKDMVVCAISLHNEIGIDVENIKRDVSFLDVAKSQFSQEEYFLIQNAPLADQSNLFFKLWTLKEAYIKAIGKGLSIPLDSFSFINLDTKTPHIIFIDESLKKNAHHWQFFTAMLSDNHQAACGIFSEHTINIDWIHYHLNH